MQWCSVPSPTTIRRCSALFQPSTAFPSVPTRRSRELARFAARRIRATSQPRIPPSVFTGVFSSAFASRSDDSTYLEGEDAFGSNSLLLPNRNLDYGYAKVDLGASFQVLPCWTSSLKGKTCLTISTSLLSAIPVCLHDPHRPASSLGSGKHPLNDRLRSIRTPEVLFSHPPSSQWGGGAVPPRTSISRFPSCLVGCCGFQTPFPQNPSAAILFSRGNRRILRISPWNTGFP